MRKGRDSIANSLKKLLTSTCDGVIVVSTIYWYNLCIYTLTVPINM